MPASSDDKKVPPPFIPIVIGVTGKRELGDKVNYVRERLQKEFSKLEVDFPNTPLVLATGLAKGADLLAAEVALERPRWTVVGILPFKEELFLEDFAENADDEWRKSFRRVLAAPPERFLLKVLKPLRDQNDTPFEDRDLHRTADNPVRRQHYEQVGLVIADRCSLLIAVMPKAEEDRDVPGKVGGTARIVRYKRYGKFDATAREVAEASEEIAPPEPLDGEVRGLVQILDPDPKEAAEQKDEQRYARMTLKQIEVFNQRVREPRTAAKVPAALQLFDATKDDPPGDYVERLRGELSGIQRGAKRRLSRSMWGLAVLFVASVVILETFAKLDVRWLFPWLDARLHFAAYAFTLLCGLGLISWVRREEWPAFTEDYRGAAEAMRVQVEWWRLGLREPAHRVDRHYLVGGEGHFAVLRSGIKAVIDAAVLLGPNPALGGRPIELEPEKEGQKPSHFWIPGQIEYFEVNSDKRHRNSIRLSSLAWYLFQLSVGIGLAIGGLLLLQQWETYRAAVVSWLALASQERPQLPFAPFAVAALWAVFFLIWVRAPQHGSLPKSASLWQRMSRWFRYRSILGTRGLHSGKRGRWWAVLLGATTVPGVLAFVMGQEIPADRELELKALELAQKISIVLMIVLAAASGAVRFVLERSVLEAEAISYRETLQRFRAARERALETRRAGADADAILEADQKLGRELGRVALAENEAWLRAHRQRPFEPVT